jgi:hypothetical protein
MQLNIDDILYVFDQLIDVDFEYAIGSDPDTNKKLFRIMSHLLDNKDVYKLTLTGEPKPSPVGTERLLTWFDLHETSYLVSFTEKGEFVDLLSVCRYNPTAHDYNPQKQYRLDITGEDHERYRAHLLSRWDLFLLTQRAKNLMELNNTPNH